MKIIRRHPWFTALVITAFSFGLFSFRAKALTLSGTARNEIIEIIDSNGNILNGVASAISGISYPNEIVQVMNSQGQILDSFGSPSQATTSPQTAGAKCDVRTVIDAAMNSGTGRVTSATANFTQKDVGKMVCVSGSGSATATVQTSVSAIHVHTCGTVSSVSNSTTAILSFTNTSGAAISSQELTLGTDDHTALQAMFTNLGNAGGGTIAWGPVACGTSVGLTVPADQKINIVGAGYQVPSWGFNPGTFYDSNNGSTLWVGTDALTGAALTLDSQAANALGALIAITAGDSWEGFSLRCGAGVDKNCGNGTSADGIVFNNIFRHNLTDVAISNFSGVGLFVSTSGTGNTPSTNGSFNGSMRIEKDWIFGNGQQGVVLDTLGTQPFTQQLNFTDDEVENNGAEGLKVATSGVVLWGLTFRNDIWQRDGTNGGITYEINFNGTNMGACSFEGANYYEEDASTSITTSVSDRTFQAVCDYKPYVAVGIDGATSPAQIFGQSAIIGTAYFMRLIPNALSNFGTCGAGTAAEGSLSCANNLTGCTNGSTAAATGTTHCIISCNGSNWIESGLTC